jgi:flavin-dependent dehydrogenase
MPETHYDVIVMGGGPAGAVTAALVSRAGYRTVLLERNPEPAFKVGESLMPATYWTFERLGVLDEMRKSAFPVKGSVQFYSADGRAATPFYFDEHDPHESSQTWQVLRSEFDDMLLKRATKDGTEVRRGVTVKEVLFEDDQAVGVRVISSAGEPEVLASRVVVDATGQRALLARQLNILENEPCLQHASFYTHFSGARKDSGKDAGATLILHTESRRSWFWFIPLPGDRVSIGVVGSVDYLIRDRQDTPQAVFDAELAQCPALLARLENAEQLLPVQVTKDYSYKLDRRAGNGWVAAGDAGGFIDPIYSTGVFVALKSGEMVADAICAGLEKDDVSATTLGAFEPELREAMRAMSQLVFAFYTPTFSFAKFLEAHPDCQGQLVDLLMGNVFRRPVDGLLAALNEEMAS